MNLPNLISLARLLSVPLELYLILNSHYLLAFWLFVLAGVSDAVDGWIAKSFNQTTWLGSYLDPIADKVLLVGVYIALGYQGLIPIWLVFLVVFRDLLIVGGVMLQFVIIHEVQIKPSHLSKLNTVVQIIFAALVLAGVGFLHEFIEYTPLLSYMVAVTTILSGAGYLISWAREMAHTEGPQ